MGFKFFVFYIFFILFGLYANAQKIKVACVGNSVTYGYLIEDRTQNAYPSVLQRMLGEKYQVRNFGHSGATLLQKGHNPYINLPEYKAAKAFKPDIVIIHLGLNDTDPRNWPNYKDEFVSDYGKLIDTFRMINPKVKISICLMTPIFSGHPRFLSGTRDWYWQEQTAIKQVSKAYHTQLINLNKPLYFHPNYYFTDDLHPNEKGAQVIAETIFAKLTGNFGGLQMSEVFGSHMVLQRDQEIPFWGKANAGEKVSVIFDRLKKTTITDADGDWRIVFPPIGVGKPHRIEIASQKQKIVLEDVLMGDVWFCSGQSNMDFPLKQSAEATEESKQTKEMATRIRLLHMHSISQTNDVSWDSSTLEKINQLKFFKGKWEVPDSKNSQDFSAIAYYFGQKLNYEIQVPIGLIQVSVGGSPIASWIDRKTLEYTPTLVPMMNHWLNTDFLFPWVRERAAKNIAATKNPLQRHPYQPAYNYEAGVSGFIHTPIKGVVWYQGESDTHNTELYASNLQLLVKSWRQNWHQDFPFYMVQISSLMRTGWPEFRNMQRETIAQIENSGMVVSSDLGDSTDVHPKQKKAIGERLASLALLKTYHRGQAHQISPYQPQLKEVKSGKICIQIDHATSLVTPKKEVPQGFELFTDKGLRILPSKISMQGAIIELNYPAKYQIEKVVYAWQPFTRANIYNELGFPISTFTLNVQN